MIRAKRNNLITLLGVSLFLASNLNGLLASGSHTHSHDHDALLVQEAERRNLGNDPKIKAATGSVRKELLKKALLERALSPKLTPKFVKSYYNSNKDRFSNDRIRLQTMLFSTEKEAYRVLKLVRENETDFQNLAEHHSHHPLAKINRGERGFLNRIQVFEEFGDKDREIFATPPYSVAGPFATPGGYTLVKVIEVETGSFQGFEEAEFRVREQAKKELEEQFVETLKKKHK